MDVITNTRAIRRRVVVPKHPERVSRELANSDLGKEGQQVARFPDGVLANLARRVRAGGVEVAEGDRAPDARLRVAQVLEDELDHVLCAAVARLGGEGGGFGDGDDGRAAVDGGGGAVDEAGGLVRLHRLGNTRGGGRAEGQLAHFPLRAESHRTHLEEVDGRGDVVGVVLDRLLATLSDSLVRGEVDRAKDAADGVVDLEDLCDVGGVGEVADEEVDLHVGLVGGGGIGGKGAEGEGRDALDGLGERVGETGGEGGEGGRVSLALVFVVRGRHDA